MFEEVPGERRGLSRLLPARRRIVLGPFVLGGGMLLAALGGSVAVAAAATVLTASAISSDVPPRPAPPTAPSSSPASSSSSHSAVPAVPASRSQHRPGRPTISAATTAAAGRSTPAAGPKAQAPAAPSSVVPPAVTSSSPAGRPPASPGPPSAAPSSSEPVGNAVIHVSGYERATGRFAYQFATAVPQAADVYVISGRQTFTAALARTATITSAGTLCPPAGSRCTPGQLIAAADSGFFAEVAIDVTGVLRSVVEVGHQAVTPKLLPVPSTVPSTLPGAGPSPVATAPVGRSMRGGVVSPQPTGEPRWQLVAI